MGSAEETSLDFNRLIRFEDKEGGIHYGDLPIDCAIEDVVGNKVPVLDGKPLVDSNRAKELLRSRRSVECIFYWVFPGLECTGNHATTTYTIIAAMPARNHTSLSLHRVEL